MCEGAKRRAAASAVASVEDGMVVGLGSGSTAAAAICHIGAEGVDVVGVPTSYQAADVARDAGIPLRGMSDVDAIDLAIDGADQVVDTTLIKGGGASHAREKVVAHAAERFFVVVDETKRADVLSAPVPVEVVPFARRPVTEAIAALGGTATVRAAERKSGPVITDNGNVVLDCQFDLIADPDELALALAQLPGVIDHGLFIDMADEIHVGTTDGVDIIRC